MKVAIFASAFYPHIGGVEELCRQLAHEIRRGGDQVYVFTERWPRDLPYEEVMEEIPVYRFPMRVPADSWKSKLSYLISHRRILGEMTTLLKELGIELIHAQCVSSSTWYALRVSRRLRIPLVVTLQGELKMDAAGIFQRPGIGQRIMRSALQQADALTACSRQTLEEAEEFHGRSFGARGRVIYNGIGLADFKAARPYSHVRPYILAIGRHVREKGFDVLLEAFAGSVDHGFDLLLAGAGPCTEELEAQTKRLCLEGKVHFLGRVDRPTAVSLFQGCTFFVLPSRHEPFGIVNLEAMAAGKAVIASRVGGVPEIVEHELNGLITPPEDVSSLRAALNRLCSDLQLREQLGAEGKRRACNFDWRNIGAEYRQVYEAMQVQKRERALAK